MNSKISPKFDNIVGRKIDKKHEKSSHGIKIVGIENDNTALILVEAIGKDCTEIVVGDMLLVPLSSIRIIFEGIEYIICSERAVFATIND